MSLKIKVHNACIQQLDNRITYLQTALNDLTEGAENDSKSSAGDKHETGRAMMQIEHEKISRQLSNVLSQQTIVAQINPALHSPIVGTGSLLKTNYGYLFICVALGKMNVEETDVIVLSMQSPLGQKLAGLKVNDRTEINGKQYIIEDVL